MIQLNILYIVDREAMLLKWMVTLDERQRIMGLMGQRSKVDVYVQGLFVCYILYACG